MTKSSIKKRLDHSKSIATNKATLASYLLLSASTFGFSLRIYDDLANAHILSSNDVFTLSGLTAMALGGSALNTITRNGLDTMNAYRRTRDHIRHFGRIDPKFLSKYRTNYCDRTGVHLAAKEAGIPLPKF